PQQAAGHVFHQSRFAPCADLPRQYPAFAVFALGGLQMPGQAQRIKLGALAPRSHHVAEARKAERMRAFAPDDIDASAIFAEVDLMHPWPDGITHLGSESRKRVHGLISLSSDALPG